MAPDQNEIKTKLNLLGVDDEALMIWLDRFPLLEGERAKTNLHLIDEHLQDRNLLGKILTQALKSADPDNALNFLERLLNVVAGDQLIAILNDSHRCRQLLTVLGGSPFLGGILCRKKNYFENLLLILYVIHLAQLHVYNQ